MIVMVRSARRAAATQMVNSSRRQQCRYSQPREVLGAQRVNDGLVHPSEAVVSEGDVSAAANMRKS